MAESLDQQGCHEEQEGEGDDQKRRRVDVGPNSAQPISVHVLLLLVIANLASAGATRAERPR